MSLDGAFLSIVKKEWEEKGLIGARVDKIHQPSKDELVINFRVLGMALKLLMSANPSSARVCITENAPENPNSPPMFCMLLRKHLSGGRLEKITQDGLERILNLDFICMNEMGDMVSNRLTVEIMGRSSNIILMNQKENEWRVIDAIKRVTDEVSSVRRILPGIVYEPPPREQRLLITDFSHEELKNRLEENRGFRLTKTIIKIFEGLSPIFAREAAHYCAKDIDISVGEILEDKSKLDRLFFFLDKANTKISPTMVKEKNGKPFDFCFIKIEQYGHEALAAPCDSANLLLDRFFKDRAQIDRSRQRAGELLKMLMNTYERILRRVENQKTELSDCKEREELKIKGDIITANIYRINKGDTELAAENFSTGEPVKIKLSEKLTPSQNAQRYYNEYRKLDTAEKMLEKLIKSGEQELVYINSVFDAAGRAQSDAEFNEIRLELIETGYLRAPRGSNSKKLIKPGKQEKPLPPLKFISSDSFQILVGRNNKGNDRLTLKLAKPDDIWLHTQNIPGSHVIISTNGEPNAVSNQTLLEAALLAAEHSKAKDSSRVPVDYALVKYVKKPPGAKPGMVIYKNNKTLFVTPKEEI